MIFLGSDHGGYKLKEQIKSWLDEWGYKWEDMGNTIYDKDDDYPEFAIKVAKKTVENSQNKGILACRSAAGMVIAANKVKGIRAVTVVDGKGAKHARLHNDANVIGLSGDWMNDKKAEEIVKVFLETKFSGEDRHLRRIKKIAEYENGIFTSE